MTTADIRAKFLEFFKQNGHAVISSASLIPENDSTVLFTTSGMHPLVPYLLGQSHPGGTRLADVQKCIRTGDIDDVGDNRHLTFFEMLGNWSLGDYFKEEAIAWSFEFLTGEHWLGLDPNRLYVSVFRGDEVVIRDDEAVRIWQEAFKTVGIEALVADVEHPDIASGAHIYPYGRRQNWWGPAGLTGPCGPDTEMYYDTGRPHDPAFGDACHPSCDCGRFIEIWNDVFMQYNKTVDGDYVPLTHRNVDTGMGLERITAVVNGKATVFETDAFVPIIEKIEALSGTSYGDASSIRSIRVVADHLRAAVFILGDERGVSPSNVEQGYVLRRLIRRAVRHGRQLGMSGAFAAEIANVIIVMFADAYPELATNQERILTELAREEEKFGKTLEKGLREFEKMFSKSGAISGEDAFVLYSTYGFPLELTEEIAKDRGQKIDRETFASEFKKHQELSRSGAEQKFAGGLADHSAETTRLHTATHLLDQALRIVLGTHVFQRGSNITSERLRFDFSHPEKITPEQLKKVEEIVNDVIKKDLPVHFEIMGAAKAKEVGAIGVFEDKYAALGDSIKVYFVGVPATGGYFSKEVCGGPHVGHTGELGGFKILKEEAVSSGVRRIKAIVGESL